MNAETKTLTEMMADFERLLDSDEYEAQKLFNQLYKTHVYAVDGKRTVGTCEFGSIECEDTPKSFYRLLFLAKPKQVNFEDMYKSSMFALVSPHGEFVAHPEFFKYELGIYFSAAPQHIEGKGTGIIGGWPGADNGRRAATPELKKWCELLEKALNKTWMVYGGNDFEV